MDWIGLDWIGLDWIGGWMDWSRMTHRGGLLMLDVKDAFKEVCR